MERMEYLFNCWDNTSEVTRQSLGDEFRREYQGNYTLAQFLDFLEKNFPIPAAEQSDNLSQQQT